MAALEATAARDLPDLLSRWLGKPVEVEARRDEGVDLMVATASGTALLIQVKRSDEIAVIDGALRAREAYSTEDQSVVPVLVVPYMGPQAREYMRDRAASWADLSGNADIRGPGLRVLVEGKPNRFASPGRPSTVFSPKATRLTRVMLVQPERWWFQREFVEASGLSGGYVSKLVRKMLDDGLLDQRPDGRLRPSSPDLLLDAWAQVADFSKHDIERFHAVGRTSAEVLRSLSGKLAALGSVRWAATGLAGAWQHTQHAGFRLVTVFVDQHLIDPDVLGLHSVIQGENVWLVVPRDEGVFHAVEEIDGALCAHPVQVYIDLLGHPERAKEAAAHLRTLRLAWEV